MENKTIRILSTRALDEAAVAAANAKNMLVDVVSFIDTVAIESEDIRLKIADYSNKVCAVIFTSMNAVNAVSHQLHSIVPPWKIFCMGNTTRRLVEDYFGKQSIIATASNAHALANEIISSQKINISAMPALFFCGDQRRDELPKKLRLLGIHPEEIVVYHTLETTHHIEHAYDGILFFSPSAVHSFFQTNTAAKDSLLFAIGETTASAIKTYTTNKVVIGDTPSKDELLMKAVDSFGKKYQESGTAK